MNYQECLSNTRTELSARVTPGATLKIQTITKNNGTHYDGLIILQPGSNIAPTIYLTPYYHRYLDGVPLEDIYNDILTTYERHLPEADFDIEMFTNFNRARSRIVMRLISKEYNQALLADIPHIDYHDLAIVFYCLVYADADNQGSILIHNSHMNMWNTCIDDLYQLAQYNTPKLLPYKFIPMAELLKTHPLAHLLDLEEIPMYILTNIYKTNGASALLYDGLLAQIADQFEQNFIILPSSIHELILIPVDACNTNELEYYTQVVHEVNETQLADDEVLSNHAYFYRRSTKELISQP